MKQRCNSENHLNPHIINVCEFSCKKCINTGYLSILLYKHDQVQVQVLRLTLKASALCFVRIISYLFDKKHTKVSSTKESEGHRRLISRISSPGECKEVVSSGQQAM